DFVPELASQVPRESALASLLHKRGAGPTAHVIGGADRRRGGIGLCRCWGRWQYGSACRLCLRLCFSKTGKQMSILSCSGPNFGAALEGTVTSWLPSEDNFRRASGARR